MLSCNSTVLSLIDLQALWIPPSVLSLSWSPICQHLLLPNRSHVECFGCVCESSPRLSLSNYSPCVSSLVLLFSTSLIPRDPHSLLDSPMYIYLSLCTYKPSERDNFLCRVPCTPDYWEIAEDTLLDFRFLPTPSGFLCLSAFSLWPLICLPRRRFLPAPWYLCTSAFWFWLLIVFLLLFYPVSLYCNSLITWLPNLGTLKTTFSAFSLVCIWFLIRV